MATMESENSIDDTLWLISYDFSELIERFYASLVSQNNDGNINCLDMGYVAYDTVVVIQYVQYTRSRQCSTKVFTT